MVFIKRWLKKIFCLTLLLIKFRFCILILSKQALWTFFNRISWDTCEKCKLLYPIPLQDCFFLFSFSLFFAQSSQLPPLKAHSSTVKWDCLRELELDSRLLYFASTASYCVVLVWDSLPSSLFNWGCP